MSTNIHLVYSRKPDSISEEDYNKWYDFHLGEILVVPGFVSAHRFKLSGEVVDPDNDTVYTHLSLYEIEGDVDQVMRDLDDEAASGRALTAAIPSKWRYARGLQSGRRGSNARK